MINHYRLLCIILVLIVERMYCMEIQNFFQNQSFHTLKETSGVIVLAMGRSGTSMLTGLLSYAGLNLGGPLLKPNSGNAKGFFERIDVMLFNDRLLQDQLMKWSGAVHQYNVPKSITFVSKMHDVGRVDLNFQTAINFMNGPENTPWIVKDPRLCITLPTGYIIFQSLLLLYLHTDIRLMSLYHYIPETISRLEERWLCGIIIITLRLRAQAIFAE